LPDARLVVGDLACLVESGVPVPGAPAATRVAAKNVLRTLRGEPSFPRYRNKGSLATIGRSAAGQLGTVRLSGPIAGCVAVLHVLFLVGFRNRFMIVFQWAWSFVSYDRGAHFITGPLRRRRALPSEERRTA
jgi:NADH dehydrogenase